jgi:AAA+ ATPase superfamily predicted ATPase
MRANPGGQLDPKDIIGRDDQIRELWATLEVSGVVLTAERRMGKTSIVKKMVAQPQGRVLPLYRDLERIYTPMEFTQAVYEDVEQYLSGLKRTTERARQFVSQLGGTEMGGILKLPDQLGAAHWKALLSHIIHDLVEHQDQAVIFFWDELPLMLYNIKGRSGEEAAMEVLDTLRSLRQTFPSLRMVFTGSIGLHNVLRALKNVGYANAPTNDLVTVDVPPLAQTHAEQLARELIEGENLHTDDLLTASRELARSVDFIPFFIHHVVRELARQKKIVNTEAIREVVEECLVDPQDRWHLRYYRERINTYYDEKIVPVALGLLDALAGSEIPLGFSELFNLLKSRIVTDDAEEARDTLTLLQRDHYVVMDKEGRYHFRFPLIQRAWKLHRGI